MNRGIPMNESNNLNNMPTMEPIQPVPQVQPVPVQPIEPIPVQPVQPEPLEAGARRGHRERRVDRAGGHEGGGHRRGRAAGNESPHDVPAVAGGQGFRLPEHEGADRRRRRQQMEREGRVCP